MFKGEKQKQPLSVPLFDSMGRLKYKAARTLAQNNFTLHYILFAVSCKTTTSNDKIIGLWGTTTHDG